ncbi:MAG: hypothetical protein JWL90_2850, partial [Chthoniobacteraceae bacterium]|nr:hypothetical protein [Chthoniobacteraceae bacterium]
VLIDSPLAVPAPGVLGNDSDADAGTTLTAAMVSGVAHGVLSLSANGAFTYTPAPGYTGPDGFTYRVSDGQVFSNTATVAILVSQPVRDVKISEIMFRPAPAFPEPESEEWIELQNTEPVSADLGGWSLTDGVSFTFATGTTIPANGRLVIVANVAAFKAKYPSVTNVVGPWSGSLANNGEKITLSDAAGGTVDSIEYASQGDWGERYIETTFNGWDWRSLADGGGRSLELRNFSVDSDNGQNWGPSNVANGTPGAANSIALSQSAPLISKVRHTPAIPTSADPITISCELKDEFAAVYLAATVFWRDATTTTPGAWNSLPMTGDGQGHFFARIAPRADKSIAEFYISATDGTLTRTWPAPGILANDTPSQTANCQFQVDNEARTGTDTYYRLTLTAAENNAFNTVSSGSDREFNQTLIVTRGTETEIHYRAGMRIRGNSSRSYQFRPLRITAPNDDPLSDGSVKFNLNPKAAPLQYLGQRTMQVMGLAASDAIPVEVRRNGVEFTTSTGSTPDYGKWTRVEAEDGAFASNHFSSSDGGNLYKKIDNGLQTNYYWRSAGYTEPTTPDSSPDGWSKSNNSSANDWSDLTHFFSVWQTAAAPHFPAAPATDVSQSTGGRLTGSGAWNSTAFGAAEMDSISTVVDLDYWARWFAVMTILQSIETNLSNGVDDDYSAYFLPGTDGLRRMIPVAHDLDTILGLGDSAAAANGRGLYDMCDNGETFRSLLPLFGNNTSAGNAAFRTLYHQKLREAYGGSLNASTTDNPNPPFYQFVDKHLAGWVPATVINNIKSFATQRQAYLLGLIGSGAITPPAATSTAALNTAHGSVMISEIIANNVAAVNVGGTFPDIIELYNSGATAADISGRSITDDPAQPLKFVFPAGTTIAAGGYLVLYADGLTTPGHLPFSLNNSGENVTLYNSVSNGGGVLDSISFGLQIPNLSIGRTGATLQTWTLTTPTFGAANAAVTSFSPPGGLFINEWLANTDFRVSSDFAEIYNPGTNPVAIGGMSFSDDVLNAPARFVLPPLSFLPASSFTRFDFIGTDATPGNATEVSFRLGATFGNLALIGQNSTVVDIVDLVSQPPDASSGRSTDGGSTIVTFAPPASLATPGASNTTPPANILNLINSLRITEIHFNPPNGNAYEFIELTNSGATALDLLGVRFVEGIDFVFPAYSLAPGAYVIVARDPSKYPTLPVVGPYSGALDNSGETLGLMLPAPRDTYIQRFAYKDSWESAADGGGSSLQFIQTSTYAGNWNDGAYWQSAAPTAGTGIPFSLSAGLDQTVLLPGYAPFNGTLSPGSASNIALTWSKFSGPGTVTFTNTTEADSSANFSQAGIYTLRLTSTSSAGTATDDVEVTVQDTYGTWSNRLLTGQSAANQIPAADPDKDGVSNAIEFVLGTNPLAFSTLGQITTANGHFGLSCTFSKLIDPAVKVFGELSSDLTNWISNADLLLTGETETSSQWLIQDPELPGTHSTRFLRLKVVLP